MHPGGEVADIRLTYKGQESLSLNGEGELQVKNSLGTLQENRPYSYQQIEGEVQEISSRFILKEGRVRFEVAPYDTNRILVIDPELVWSTYYGTQPIIQTGEEDHEEAYEKAFSVTTDNSNNVYIVGEARRNDPGFATYQDQGFPTQQYDPSTHKGGDDMFIAKFDSEGKRIWSAYYGGSGNDIALDVSTDNLNNVIVCGFTESVSGIPYNGYDMEFNELENQNGNRFNRDAFVVKFTADGVRTFATYYGGESALFGETKAEEAWGVSTDTDQNIYITGFTTSSNFIASSGAYDESLAGESDAFLVKFDPEGGREWATYFGGGGREKGLGICLDPAGDIYITGLTESQRIAVNGYDETYAGGVDAFIAKFYGASSSLEGQVAWASYVGGPALDHGNSLVADQFFVYLAGVTESSTGIVENATFPGYDNTYGGGKDAFLASFASYTGTLMWATYFGGEAWEGLHPVGVFYDGESPYAFVDQDAYGRLYLAGLTTSKNEIATQSSMQPDLNGAWEGYVACFNNTGTYNWSSYFGGEYYDAVKGVAIDNFSNVYLTGVTYSSENISQNGYQNNFFGSGDAFLAKISTIGDTPEGPKDIGEKDEGTEGRASEEFSLKLFPNPTSGRVEVNYTDTQDGPYRIHILDKRGNEVYQSEKFDAPLRETLDLRKLKRGTYSVILYGHKAMQTAELQIQ